MTYFISRRLNPNRNSQHFNETHHDTIPVNHTLNAPRYKLTKLEETKLLTTSMKSPYLLHNAIKWNRTLQ